MKKIFSRKCFNDLYKNKKLLYEVDLEHDIDKEKSGCLRKGEGIQFIMANPHNLLSERWKCYPDDVEFIPLKERCHCTKNRNNQLLFTCEYPVKRDVIYICISESELKEKFTAIYSVKSKKMTERAKQIAKENNTINDIVDEKWIDLICQNKKTSWLTNSIEKKEKREVSVIAEKNVYDVCVLKKEAVCYVNGQKININEIDSSEKFISVITIDESENSTIQDSFPQNHILIGDNCGWVYFKPICFSTNIKKVKMITIANKELEFEVYNKSLEQWELIKGCIDLREHQINLRVKMYTGTELLKIYFVDN